MQTGGLDMSFEGWYAVYPEEQKILGHSYDHRFYMFLCPAARLTISPRKLQFALQVVVTANE